MNFIKWYELNHLWCCHFNIKKLNRNTDGAKMSPTTTISCPQCNAMPFDNLYCFAFLLLGRWSFIASPILRCGLFVNCNAWLSTAHNVFALLCYCSKMPCNDKGYLLHVLSPHPPTHPLLCHCNALTLVSLHSSAMQFHCTTHRESSHCSYLSSPNCCYWYCFEWHCSYSSIWSGVLLCTMLHLLAVENFSVQLLWEGRPPAFQKGGNCCGRPTSLTSPFTLFHISAMSHHQLDSDSPKENDMVDWCFLCFVLQCLHT